MSRTIPPAERIASVQAALRTEAKYWRTIDRELEAQALDSYARILEKIRQHLLDEEVERGDAK